VGQAATVQVPINGSVESAIKEAVAEFQRRHKGQLPKYVFCPKGVRVGVEHILSWAVRGVAVVTGPASGDSVRAA